MSAPSWASRTACARPWPRAAPVMKATLPSTRPVMCYPNSQLAETDSRNQSRHRVPAPNGRRRGQRCVVEIDVPLGEPLSRRNIGYGSALRSTSYGSKWTSSTAGFCALIVTVSPLAGPGSRKTNCCNLSHNSGIGPAPMSIRDSLSTTCTLHLEESTSQARPASGKRRSASCAYVATKAPSVGQQVTVLEQRQNTRWYSNFECSR